MCVCVCVCMCVYIEMRQIARSRDIEVQGTRIFQRSIGYGCARRDVFKWGRKCCKRVIRWEFFCFCIILLRKSEEERFQY